MQLNHIKSRSTERDHHKKARVHYRAVKVWGGWSTSPVRRWRELRLLSLEKAQADLILVHKWLQGGAKGIQSHKDISGDGTEDTVNSQVVYNCGPTDMQLFHSTLHTEEVMWLISPFIVLALQSAQTLKITGFCWKILRSLVADYIQFKVRSDLML